MNYDLIGDKMCRRIFCSLMLLNNSKYSFFSGIFVSLAINVFTGLCASKDSFIDSWHMYLASIVFLLLGLIMFIISAKTQRFQEYIEKEHITDQKEIDSIVKDRTKGEMKVWISLFVAVFILFTLGVALLIYNFR